MNQQDKIELSKRVAEKYGVDAQGYVAQEFDPRPSQIKRTIKTIQPIYIWLADDDARCFKLAVDNELGIYIATDSVCVFLELNQAGEPINEVIEIYADHPDKYEATRIAILKCLDAMKGE